MTPPMKTSTRLVLLSLVVVSSLSFADEPAAAEGGSGMRRSGYLLDASSQERPMLLGIHAIVPYGYGFFGFGLGAGATFYIPLVKDGFIPPVNDEFGIDFGADLALFFAYSSAPFSITIPVCALWTFHITDKFSAYAKVGIALRIHPGWSSPVLPDWVSVLGVNYMFSKGFGIRAEGGYPGLKIGILLAF